MDAPQIEGYLASLGTTIEEVSEGRRRTGQPPDESAESRTRRIYDPTYKETV